MPIGAFPNTNDCEVFSVNKQLKRYRIMRIMTILSVVIAILFFAFQVFIVYLDRCPDETFIGIQRALPWLFGPELTDFGREMKIMEFFHYISIGIVSVITLCMLIFFISTFQEDLNLKGRRAAVFYTLLVIGLVVQFAIFFFATDSTAFPILLLYVLPFCVLLLLIAYLYFRFSSENVPPAPIHSVWTGYILFLCACPISAMYAGGGAYDLSDHGGIQTWYFTVILLISLFLMAGDTRRYGIAIGRLDPPIAEKNSPRAAGWILTVAEILTVAVLAAEQFMILYTNGHDLEETMDPILGAAALCALVLMLACTFIGMRVRLGVSAAKYTLHYLLCIAASIFVCIALSGIWAETRTLSYAIFTGVSSLLLAAFLLLLMRQLRRSRAPFLYLWGTMSAMGT